MRKMRSLGIGIVYIAHRLDEIFEVADRVTILKDGKLVGTHPIGSLTRDSMINPMVGRRLEQIFPPRPATPTQGPVVLAVDRLTAVDRVEDVSLSVREGEIVAIAGMVGSGRTEVAEAVFGARAIDSGAIYRRGGNSQARASPVDWAWRWVSDRGPEGQRLVPWPLGRL
jgi:ribose transport system ATP-binding protein